MTDERNSIRPEASRPMHTKSSSTRYTGNLRKEPDGTVSVNGHLNPINLNGRDTSQALAVLLFIRQVYKQVINSYLSIPTPYKPCVHSITWTVEITWANGKRKDTREVSSGNPESTT